MKKRRLNTISTANISVLLLPVGAFSVPLLPELAPLGLLFLVLAALSPQELKRLEQNEFWPEIDVYINVKPTFRLYVLGTVSNRWGGEQT